MRLYLSSDPLFAMKTLFELFQEHVEAHPRRLTPTREVSSALFWKSHTFYLDQEDEKSEFVHRLRRDGTRSAVVVVKPLFAYWPELGVLEVDLYYERLAMLKVVRAARLYWAAAHGRAYARFREALCELLGDGPDAPWAWRRCNAAEVGFGPALMHEHGGGLRPPAVLWRLDEAKAFLQALRTFSFQCRMDGQAYLINPLPGVL